jgi:diguanylate cyclase (GGDEF)-like protein
MLKSKPVQALLISAIFCAAYFLWIAPLEPSAVAALKLIDSYYNLSSRMSHSPGKASGTVLIAVDDESLRRVNIQWPWPRSVIAGVIDRIGRAGPRLICVDLVFAGKSVDPQEDTDLVDVFKNSKNVLGAAYFGNDGRYVIPDEPIALSLADFGFVNKPKDADGGVRRMRPYLVSQNGGIIDYSLSLKVAARAVKENAASVGAAVPLSGDGTAYIKFFAGPNELEFIPVWKVMEGVTDISALKDKLVFFGVTSESFHDTYPTPLGIMPGVAIDMNETLTYLNGRFFSYGGGWTDLAITASFAIIAVAAALALPILAGIAFAAMLLAAAFFLGLFLFSHNIIIDAFGPLLVITISTIVLHSIRSILIVFENIVLKKEAVTDGLTGLYVYRYFELQLKRELENARRLKKDLALVIYDIDHFKKINDTYGHEFGNTVLRSVAKSLRNHSRKSNIIARYGGEEFCIIITGMDRDHAVKYSERLRDLVGSLEFKTDKGGVIKITVSAGLAMASEASGDHSDFVKAADSALYKSKSAGRNRLTIFEH